MTTDSIIVFTLFSALSLKFILLDQHISTSTTLYWRIQPGSSLNLQRKVFGDWGFSRSVIFVQQHKVVDVLATMSKKSHP